MALRQIVKIDEDKCTGCGLCIPKCAEGALQIIDGKAKLVDDKFCDGLGACLGDCPEGAITIIEREADDFDIEAAEEHVKELHKHEEKEAHAHAHHGHAGHQCPSSQAMTFASKEPVKDVDVPSALTSWPVKIELVSPKAPFFGNADVVVAADCAAFAYGNFHNDIMKGKVILIGCPKLSDSESYYHKITAILKENDLRSLSVVHMEVPCCFGLVHLVEKAIETSGKDIKLKDIVIGIKGDLHEG